MCKSYLERLYIDSTPKSKRIESNKYTNADNDRMGKGYFISYLLAMRKFNLSYILIGIVNFSFGLAVIGLSLRMLFKLLDANPDSGFVSFLYNSTSPLLSPFRGIFENPAVEPGHILEFTTLIAIAVYVLLAYLIIELVEFLSAREVTK